MAEIIPAGSVESLANDFPMGEVWEAASAAERASAVRLTQGIWRSLDWTTDPFEDTPAGERLRDRVRPLLALHARSVLETGGSTAFAVPPEIMSLLRVHLEHRKMLPLGTPAIGTSPAAGIDLDAVAAAIRNRVAPWALSDDTELIPTAKLPPSTGGGGGGTPYILPAASAGTRGGVFAITNAIIDANRSTGVFGWAISHVRRLVESVVPSWARNETPPRAVPDNATRIGQFLRAVSLRQGTSPGLYGWGDVRELPSGGSDGQVVSREGGVPVWADPPMGTGDAGDDAFAWATVGNDDDIPTSKLGALTGSSATVAAGSLPPQVQATHSSRLATTAAIPVGDTSFARTVEVEIDVGLSSQGFQPQIQVQVLIGSTVAQSRLVDPNVDGTFTFPLPANRTGFSMAITCTGGNNFTASLRVTDVRYRHSTWAEFDDHVKMLARIEASAVTTDQRGVQLFDSEQTQSTDPVGRFEKIEIGRGLVGHLDLKDPTKAVIHLLMDMRTVDDDGRATQLQSRGDAIRFGPGLTATEANGILTLDAASGGGGGGGSGFTLRPRNFGAPDPFPVNDGEVGVIWTTGSESGHSEFVPFELIRLEGRTVPGGKRFTIRSSAHSTSRQWAMTVAFNSENKATSITDISGNGMIYLVAFGGGGGAGGLSQSQVNNLIRETVEDWAEVGNAAKIPANKLPAGTGGGGTPASFSSRGPMFAHLDIPEIAASTRAQGRDQTVPRSTAQWVIDDSAFGASRTTGGLTTQPARLDLPRIAPDGALGIWVSVTNPDGSNHTDDLFLPWGALGEVRQHVGTDTHIEGTLFRQRGAEVEVAADLSSNGVLNLFVQIGTTGLSPLPNFPATRVSLYPAGFFPEASS